MPPPSRPARGTRGRPLKFGRPAQLVTLTLPDDVVAWLTAMDADLGWAVVRLHERSLKTEQKRQNSLADLVQLPGRRALILVKPQSFENLKGISIIPLADGRGFLALDPGKGVADLELAVIDRLDEQGLPASERADLQFLRQQLRSWRDEGTEFESRSIIVAKRDPSPSRGRALSPIRPVGR
jgi:hypothetical protein